MDEVFSALRAVADEVFAGQPVTFAYLFGSHARGEGRPHSDVDVAVHLDDTVAPSEYLDLGLRLAGELAYRSGVGPIHGVVVLNEAPIRLVGRVLSDRRVLYSTDERVRVRYEVQMRARALDFEPRAAALDRQLLARMAGGRG